MEPNHKGDMAEIQAAAWLMSKGYKVYRNLGCTGRVDLIAMQDDEDPKPVMIQVKGITARKLNHGEVDYYFKYKGMKEDLDAGIKPLWVCLRTGTVGWNRDYF